MLELKKIKKSYRTGDFFQHALKGVSLQFRKQEFVAILGPSGSGKTTLLNIIGGLDRYDSGDLILNEKSTKKFKDKDWDAYRNNCVGFIFQSYHLISHIDVLSNVEMAMTLSGISPKQRRAKAKEVLKKVGLQDHMHKKPNQLSGGQMQRVAIARAIVNDPEIILADEPTGALDSKTSIQIMNLIEEIAKDKLVIMVTHNPELATTYADRIIEMKDGEILQDSRPYEKTTQEETENLSIKKTSMNFWTALHLSFNNIRTKKGRTILTAFASSIGIIGIALILSLSNGFQAQIDQFERNSIDAMPIMLYISKMDLDEDTFKEEFGGQKQYSDEKSVTLKDSALTSTKLNPMTSEFVGSLKEMPQEYLSSVMVNYDLNFNFVQKVGDEVKYVNDANDVGVMPMKNFWDSSPSGFLTDYYEILQGHMPTKKEEVLLMVRKDNTIPREVGEILGLKEETTSFDDILGRTVKIVKNNDFYTKVGNYFTMNEVTEEMYDNPSNVVLEVVGIMRLKEEKSNVMTQSGYGILVTQELQDYIKNMEADSDIVVAQKKANYQVLTGIPMDENSESGKMMKETTLAALGGEAIPYNINLYPKDFDAKEKILEYIKAYNQDKEEEKQVSYVDQSELITSVSGNIMDGITVVLIAFSSISLVVSSIMIGIIMYISVLERTKEIGILRSLGARKKDISRVFNAETFIIGLSSGIIGIVIARLLLIPVNVLLKNLTDLDQVGILNPIHALILIFVSLVLTLMGGAIPARVASKKDPVIALRTE